MVYLQVAQTPGWTGIEKEHSLPPSFICSFLRCNNIILWFNEFGIQLQGETGRISPSSFTFTREAAGSSPVESYSCEDNFSQLNP